MSKIRFVGLDVHADTIAVAVAETGLSQEIRDIAWKAQNRLHLRYRKFLARGKNKPQIVTAVGRELLGFIWAIGVKVEAEQQRIAA